VPSTIKVTEKKSKRTSKGNSSQPSNLTNPILDNPKPIFKALGGKIVDIYSHFSRYSWDILGVALLALAFIGLLGVTGLTQGSWISPLAFEIKRFFGWGSLFLITGLVVLSLFLIRLRNFTKLNINISRILAFEGFAFAGLILLSILSGYSESNLNLGSNFGGIIGWGLAELLLMMVGSTFRLIIVILILIICLLIALKVPEWILKLIDKKIKQELTLPTNPILQTFEVKIEPISPPQRDQRLPPLNLLAHEENNAPDEMIVIKTGELIEKSLAEFGIPATVTGYRIGPTVTQYAIEPGYVEKPTLNGQVQRQKVRVSHISMLSRDLALALSADRLRIEAPVPGRSYVGIEVPNIQSTLVRLRSILESETFTKEKSRLTLALGRDVSGQAVVADLGKMPHLLIAGTTGSGKSVCIIAITTCLVMNNAPSDLRLVMIDPKMVELIRFNGIPHLMGKVETEIERILAVFRWTLGEMDNRYRLFEEVRARDLEAYNKKMERKKQATLPRIVVIVDELADLMMTFPDQTEQCLVRLAQMARATGIHLIVATQRPSTDIVTGVIKANFPARISFTVASSVDSRVILDTSGAESLLGRGDMLFLNPEMGSPVRSQGVFVTDQELERVINFWRKMEPEAKDSPAPWEAEVNKDENSSDALIKRAIEIVEKGKKASTSLLQRRLRVGYPRAARLMDELEELGIVGPSQGGGREREVLVQYTPEDADEDDGGNSDDTDYQLST
jgi:DNA segregation ATPase FtsK/SpoIIIE, S-DNA-T family